MLRIASNDTVHEQTVTVRRGKWILNKRGLFKIGGRERSRPRNGDNEPTWCQQDLKATNSLKKKVHALSYNVDMKATTIES